MRPLRYLRSHRVAVQALLYNTSVILASVPSVGTSVRGGAVESWSGSTYMGEEHSTIRSRVEGSLIGVHRVLQVWVPAM